MELFVIGCVAVIGLAICTFVMMIRPIDVYLNYSMKRKINTKKIPLYFPSDRVNESLHGPSLENPNVGTYLPAFVCAVVTYSISTSLLILLVIIQFTIQDIEITKCVVEICFIIMLGNAIVDCVLREHYKKKYFLNQEQYKNKIMLIKCDNEHAK